MGQQELTKVYAVFDGPDESYSGYCYTSREIAEQHAARVYLGSVREFGPARDTLPEWVAELTVGDAQ